MQNPLITVITSTLNASRELPYLSHSLAIQTYQNFEWLIVDGGSTDKTLEFIKKDNRSKLICSEQDKGIYEAWNKGLNYANGEWILFLGADDLIVNENIFQNFSEFTEKIPKSTDIIYGKVIADENIIGKKILNLKKEIKKKMCLCHQATFHNKDIFKKVGFFKDSYKISGDYELLLRSIVKHNKKAIFINQLITLMGTSGISTNKCNGYLSAIENYRSRKDNDIFPINLIWIRHYIAAIYYKIYYFLKKFIKN